MIAPADGAVFPPPPVTVTFSWEDIPGAHSSQFRMYHTLSEAQSDIPFAYFMTLCGFVTSQAYDFQYEETSYWRVLALGDKAWGYLSPIRSLTISPQPASVFARVSGAASEAGIPASAIIANRHLISSTVALDDESYVLRGLGPGTYNLTASKTGFDFLPSARTVTVAPHAVGVNFASTEIQCYISGQVTDGSGNPIPGVNVSALGVYVSRTSITDSNGNYVLSPLFFETYTVTPSKNGYAFSPSSLLVSVPPDATDQNFAATLLSSAITG